MSGLKDLFTPKITTIAAPTLPTPGGTRLPTEGPRRQTSRRAQKRGRRKGRRSTILTDQQDSVGSSGSRLGA